jgi:uncharacterized membrane protein YcaP (DUF421 family)
MFSLTVPWWELALRGGVVFVSVLLALRLSGKRQVGELTPFDLVLLLLISEAASPSLTNEDTSWTAAIIVIATMLVLNALIGRLAARSRRFDRWLEGRPQFLIRRGRVQYRVLRRESISKNDLMAAIRAEGCNRPSQVECAVLETSGKISVKRLAD